MNYKFLHRFLAAMVFLISAIQLFMTAQPSVSFWDPGELSAAAYALQIPHPPGGPLFSLVGHIFYMLPLPGNIGFRMNTVSILASAFSVLFLYLIAVRLMKMYKGRDPQNMLDALGTYVSAATGALAFSFCDTIWFNGSESNYFAASTCLFSTVVWLMLVWYEKSNEPGSWKYFIMMAYLVGLSTGVHLMSVLSIFTVVMLMVLKLYIQDDEHCRKTGYIFLGHVALMLIISLAMWNGQTASQPPAPEELKDYDTNFKVILAIVSVAYMGLFWKKVFNRNSFYLPLAVAGVALAVVYPTTIKKLPSLLLLVAGDNSSSGLIVLVIMLGLLGYLALWAKRSKRIVLAVASLALIFTIIGFTTYTMTIIRANQHPTMNENNPDSFSRLVSYLNREQYGDFPIFKRRWSGEPQHQSTWTKYSSDLDFFWNYQMNHMFNRYVLWNFAGRESFVQDAGVDWKRLYGIPFFVGLLGLYFHFRKDWKLASAFLVLFMFMGYLTVFYQNQQEWQPRERDYFYGGAYFVFAIWIALGIRGLLDIVEQKMSMPGKATPAFIGILLVGVIFIPGRMLQTNYFTHDRSKNWLPWDYSYNLLQSCAPNAILFTNGDNDTFPLWYLQDVEGIRRDIRIVNLSLVNTEWYIKQLKHESPFGTPTVKISFSDDFIDRLQPMQWKPQMITLPVPRQVIAGETANTLNIIDTAVYNKGAITFTMPATLHYGNISAIRVQDIMVKEIVQQNVWQRPIYFASTCGEDTKIGLGEYLKIEGFAGRLVPQKGQPNPNVRYYVDESLMRKNLLEENPGISKTYKPGFLFRGLNDKNIFYDENHERMAMNCRGSFMMLATHYLYGTSDKTMCIKTLNRMEQVLPRTIIKMDYRQQFEIALMYFDAGEMTKFKELANEVEDIAQTKISGTLTDANESSTLYQILVEIYDRTEQYSKAVELMQRLQVNYPTDQGLKQAIDRYKGLAERQKNGQTSH